MVPRSTNQTPELISQVLDEAMGKVKPSAFTTLFALGQIVQESPGEPITMITLSTKTDIGERTLQGVIQALRKKLLVDFIVTPKGNIYEFLEPVPTFEISTPPAGRNFFGSTELLTTHLPHEEDVAVGVRSRGVSGRGSSSSQKPRSIVAPEVLEIASTFRSYATPLAKQRITPRRYAKYLVSAWTLVHRQNRPLEEIHQVVAFVFENWNAHLPFPVLRGESKVTNLGQIVRHYDRIVQHMTLGEPDDPSLRSANFLAPLDDSTVESQAQDLTERFKQFRLMLGDRSINDHRIAGWTKTFRILLSHDNRPFEGLVELVDSMAYCWLEVDADRYTNAFHIRAEFDLLASFFPKLRQALEMRSQRHTEPRTPHAEGQYTGNRDPGGGGLR